MLLRDQAVTLALAIMGRTPEHVKIRIVSLSSKSKSINAIVRQLQDEGIKIRRQTVARIIKRYNEEGSLADKPASGRKPILTLEQMTFIDEKMEANDELTAVGKNLIEMITVVRETIYSNRFQFTISGLQKLLYSELGVHLSTATIKRARKKLGWRKCGPRYCQIVREANRVARLAFAQQCLDNNEDFDNVIFTDESTIWLERHGKVCFRKEGTPGKLKPRGKHPFKVNIWAGISKRSATPVLIFTGIMKKEFYVGEILEKVLLPFTQSTFPDGDYRFQQDNDPKHKSKFITLSFLPIDTVAQFL